MGFLNSINQSLVKMAIVGSFYQMISTNGVELFMENSHFFHIEALHLHMQATRRGRKQTILTLQSAPLFKCYLLTGIES